MLTFSQLTGAIRSPSVQTVNDIALHTISVTLSDGTTAVRKDFELSKGKDAYGYIVADAIRTLKGELQLDVENGIDYAGTVWAGRKNIGKWMRAVKKKVIGYDFVSSIVSFTASVPREGVLEYMMVATTTDGGTIVVKA